MNDTILSIIVPIYNAEEFISSLIPTLSSIHYSEVIAVNDGSQDNSLFELEKLTESCKNLKIVSQKNSGVSSARNRGLCAAVGEYIFFVDADDFVDANLVNKILEDIKGKKMNGIIYFGLTDKFIKNGKVVRTGNAFTMEAEMSMLEFMMRFGYFLNNMIIYTPCNKFYKREIIEKYDVKFDESYVLGEDALFNLEIFNYTNILKFYPYDIYFYNHFSGRSNTGSTKYVKNEMEISIEIYKKIIKLIEKYNVRDKNEVEFHKFIIRRISALINGVHCPTSPMKEKEKLFYLRRIYNEKVFYEAISDKSVIMDGKKDKLMLFLYRRKSKVIIYLLYKINAVFK